MKRLIWTAGILVGLLALLIAVFGMVFTSAAMHVPRRPVPDPAAMSLGGAGVDTVRMRAQDGSALEAWWMQPVSRNGRCVMVLHGIGDSRAGSGGFAPMFLDAGYAVLVPDSRAHGESGGELVTYGIQEEEDVIRWAAWLRSAGYSRIYGLGESFGGAVLIQASALKPVFRAVVAESAYSDLRSVARYRLAEAIGPSVPFRGALTSGLATSALLFGRLRHGFDFDRHSPLRAIAQTETPILLVHGSEDVDTPPSHSATLAAAGRNSTLWIVPGARHCGAAAAAPAEFRRRVLAWFAEH